MVHDLLVYHAARDHFIINKSIVTIPRGLKGTRSSLKKQLQLFAYPRIVLAFFIPAFSIAATYSVFTYLAPLLQDVLLVPARYISLVFLLYGVVSIFSTLIGGKLAVRNGMGKIRYVLLAQAIILTSLYFTSGSLVGGLVSISLMALVVYLMNSTMQLYFIDWADQRVPEAKDLAASLTSVSVNVGIAIGSAVGGFVTTNMKLIDLSWVGGLVAVLAAVLALINYRLGRKARSSASNEEMGLQGQWEGSL